VTASSGIGSDGQWQPAFEGQRPPAARGNQLAAKHGAYATLALGDRVGELAPVIAEHVPGYTVADEIAVRLLALALARLERSSEALAETTDVDALNRLRQDERGWANTVRRYLSDLGLTPTARAKLGLDVVRAKGEALRALHDHVEQTGGEDAA
jgi:hypothetical protein